MPDESWKLTEDDLGKIQRWMNDHQMSCPGCQSRELSMADYLVGIPPIVKGELQTAGKNISVLPLIPLTCSRCGFVVHLNARTVDILVAPFPSSSSAGDR